MRIKREKPNSGKSPQLVVWTETQSTHRTLEGEVMDYLLCEQLEENQIALRHLSSKVASPLAILQIGSRICCSRIVAF